MCLNLTACFEIIYYIMYANQIDRPGKKATICKISNFSLYCYQYLENIFRESRDIFSTDSYLMKQAIEKSETTKFLCHYALFTQAKSYFRYILN